MLKVLEIALAEVGYREGSGNMTKFAAELDRLSGFYNGKKNGYAWCDVFVDYCFVTAYGRELAQKLLCQPDNSAGAGCTYSAQYYQRAGRWSDTPQVGAQVFFGNAVESYHTGLVYAVDANKVYTVEGNTSDMVAKREYWRSYPNIYGYGLPDYSLVGGYTQVTDCAGETEYDKYSGEYIQNWHEDSEYDEVVYATAAEEDGTPESVANAPMCTPSVPELRYGDMGEAVRAMQHLLIVRGFTVGRYGPDGEAGTDTEAAMRRFQQTMGLEVDGVCGAMTWARLITG